MTKADKIYDIAEKLGYTGSQDGSTVDAINAISDTLGYSGTHQQRISGALADLNTVVTGGGGGGVSLGGLVMSFKTDVAPVVGATATSPNEGYAQQAFIGDQLVTAAVAYGTTLTAPLAAGITVQTDFLSAYSVSTCDLYRTTINMQNGEYLTVEKLDVEVEKVTRSGTIGYAYKFVLPELQQGEYLAVYLH